MSRLQQLMRRTWSTTPTILSSRLFTPDNNHLLPPTHLAQLTSTRFLDIYQIGNKAAIEKERARLSDEMNRGYFADINELKQHGGKIAAANKVIIPAVTAVKFPALEVNYSDGRIMKMPITSATNDVDADNLPIPKVSLLCLSFRANFQHN